MKLKVFWLVFLICLPGFAQEDDITRPEDLEQRVHVLGSSPDAPPDQPVENSQNIPSENIPSSWRRPA